MSEQNKESEWTKREMGAFWKRQSQKGQSYLSGHVTLKLDDGSEAKVKVVVFKNKNKTSNEKAPDYCVYASTPPQQENASESTSSESQNDEDVL
tara:strand:+ start:264 stop:545 length:282 start_codon:yes stop_codon:yes gene_type:complete